ncbi:hypothetical protein C5167_021440 [Papaver somniferum]|uniref:MLP-like protein 423 n=1 Tax=Papaver somniferum TaxID=3469 RepID=UPI000E6FA7A1|nr:MLP-like protein 423 [Papaver somniferum]RZC94194.1 hypothetical protein C5167_021440 [Papaver somniferum]
MAQIHKVEGQFVAKTHADKLYNMITRGAPTLPKYVPQLVHKCQVLPEEGEIRPGSIYVWDYAVGATEGILSPVRTKNKVIAVDHKNMSITQTMFEGHFTSDYPSFDVTIDVTPIHGGGNNKTMVKWSFKYEKENEHVPAPTSFIKFFEVFFKELDAKMLEHET